MMASYAASPCSLAAGKVRSWASCAVITILPCFSVWFPSSTNASGPYSGLHYPALPLGFTKVPSRNTVIPITKPLLTLDNPHVHTTDKFQPAEFLVATSLTANQHTHAIFQYTLAGLLNTSFEYKAEHPTAIGKKMTCSREKSVWGQELIGQNIQCTEVSQQELKNIHLPIQIGN